MDDDDFGFEPEEAETFSEEGPGACVSCGVETKNPRETQCRECAVYIAEPELFGEEED